jgi:hypothetical protein
LLAPLKTRFPYFSRCDHPFQVPKCQVSRCDLPGDKPQWISSESFPCGHDIPGNYDLIRSGNGGLVPSRRKSQSLLPTAPDLQPHAGWILLSTQIELITAKDQLRIPLLALGKFTNRDLIT